MGHLVALGGHTHLAQDVVYLGADGFLVAPAGGAEDELEVVVHGAVDEQAEVLEDDAELAPEVGDVAAAHPAEVVAEHARRARRDGRLAVEGLEQRTLPAAHFAQQEDELPAVHLQVDVAQDDEFLLADVHAVVFYQCLHDDNGWWLMING